MIETGGARSLCLALSLGVLGAALPAVAWGAPADIAGAGGERFAPGQVLVRYQPGTSGGERAAVRDDLDADLERKLLVPRLELLSLAPGDSVKQAVAELDSQPHVADAEPNFVYKLAATPNDPDFQVGTLWGLDNTGLLGGLDDADIDAPEAWDTPPRGSGSVVVGVVDSGVAMDHPDLDGNIWSNPAEAGGTPGVDDDVPANGFVDDVNGWDFVSPRDNDPTDREGHGTHVAGTIGAEGDNGVGVVGVNWDVSLMPLRACDELGSCLSSDVADAFAYAGANGARVVNASLSGSSASFAQQAAIATFPDTLFVVAAGNEGNNNDASPRYPCNYTAANLICVGATNDEDNLASFSNFGPDSVDIAAPGGGSPGAPVYSTYALSDRVNETFTNPLGVNWDTGGSPDTWARTSEASELPGTTLTDSPGANYANNADNFARFGPVDLGSDSGCYLRYDLALSIPDNDDHLVVEASTDDLNYTAVQVWTGTGEATLTPDLSLFSGSPTVYVRFRLESDAALAGDGAHVDNVRIRCPAPVYAYLQGTSMATPHVAGTAALLLSHNGAAGVADLRAWLLDGADVKSSLQDRVGAGGRLNADRSVDGAMGLDIHRPQTAIVNGPPVSSRATTASFGFTADEPATFSCSHNGAVFAPCSSPGMLSKLAIGTHSFRVKAIDTAGNEDGTPAAYTFTVEPALKLTACQRAKRKLRKARTERQKRKLRKQVKKKCAKKTESA